VDADNHPVSLSVSADRGHVIVVYSDGRLCEFPSSTRVNVLQDGGDENQLAITSNQLVRNHLLPVNSFRSLRHAVSISCDGDFVVCHGSSNSSHHRVCCVTVRRHANEAHQRVETISAYGAGRGSSPCQLNQPYHLAVDDICARVVYVADYHNRRVIALSVGTLVKLGEVDTRIAPRRLCSVRDRLYVGLDNGSVVVYQVALVSRQIVYQRSNSR